MEIIVLTVGALAIFRWYKTPEKKRYILNIKIKIPKHETKLDKFLSLIIVILLITAGGLFSYIIIMPKPIEKVTAFYLLGPTALVSDYPHELSVGENKYLIIGIENHEARQMNYTIEIWLVNQTTNENITTYHNLWFMDKINVTLDSVPLNTEEWNPQWETRYYFNVTRKGYFKLAFLLYTTPTYNYKNNRDYRIIAEKKIDEDLANSYKNVYIWLDVK